MLIAKLKKHRNRISVIIYVLFLSFLVLNQNISWGDLKGTQENRPPLLLNSELIASDAGEARYIVWTEDDNMISQIEARLKSTGLIWNKEKIADYSGRHAYKYSAMANIVKSNEHEAFLLYQALNTLANKKTKVFFQETVETALDVAAFFNSNNIKISQEVQSNDIISISGFARELPSGVKSGIDIINIQVLAKESKIANPGKVVLALPSLIEEF